MKNEDFELTLFDRLETIKSINREYDLESNSYVSFSGGKDSTILHHLIDMAIPNNKIPRVFINTGIEYNMMVEFVKELQKTDDRIIIINSGVNIKKMLEQNGYPFKSKEHSKKLGMFQNGSSCKSVIDYMKQAKGTIFRCPNQLLYQFTNEFKLNVSDQCCYQLKKNPIHKWEKENNRHLSILGLRQNEGGQRANHTGCVVLDKKGKIRSFKPLNPVSNEFEDWFIEKYKIQLCKLYYPPYNFKRTGCAGCPYSLTLQEDLETLALLLPNERKKCEIIWQKVYEEYRRIGFRLSKNEQVRLF